MWSEEAALRGAGLQVVISKEDIQEKVSVLARSIDADYQGKDLLMVAVLRGAVIFLADLMRALRGDVQVDFMAVSSYGDSTESSGIVRILKDLDDDIRGRHVLLVEDIVDSGLTLGYLLANLRQRQPASLEVCALLDKRSSRAEQYPLRYVGFEVGDDFLVGYGLDIAGRFRGLDSICRMTRGQS